MGAAPLGWQPVAGGGYAENTADWRVELEDGRRVFVKEALDELAAGWLRKEHRIYAAVSAPFMPELVGWHAGDPLLLVLEDLQHPLNTFFAGRGHSPALELADRHGLCTERDRFKDILT